MSGSIIVWGLFFLSILYELCIVYCLGLLEAYTTLSILYALSLIAFIFAATI